MDLLVTGETLIGVLKPFLALDKQGQRLTTRKKQGPALILPRQNFVQVNSGDCEAQVPDSPSAEYAKTCVRDASGRF